MKFGRSLNTHKFFGLCPNFSVIFKEKQRTGHSVLLLLFYFLKAPLLPSLVNLWLLSRATIPVDLVEGPNPRVLSTTSLDKQLDAII